MSHIIDVEHSAGLEPHYEFEPGDGTRYMIHLMDAKYGGVYVIVNEISTWRYHEGDCLKFLCGINDPWAKKAVWDYLEALS